VSRSRPPPTRDAHATFVRTEGWQPVASTHHETHELELHDGRVLRTRISRPPDRTTHGPSLWAHVLRDQLDVTEQEFWDCVRDGVAPDRGAPQTPDPAATIPAEVVHLLVERVGLTREQVAALGRDGAITRLNEYWADGG